jgi:HAD superfamily hydrolase (TIGR01549 family)
MPFSPHPTFVFFDLDDTLLDHRSAEKAALGELYCAHPAAFEGHTLDALLETYHRINVALWASYAAGDIDRDTVQRERFTRCCDALRLALDPSEASAFYMDRYTRHWSYRHGAREAFLAIADTFPTGILTNGFAEVQHAKLDRFPELRHRTHAVVISEEIGFMKPHPQLFAEAARRACAAPAEILYVGDSYRSDIEGARKAGWQAAWYTDDEAAEGGHEAFRFREWGELTGALLGEDRFSRLQP